MWRTRRYIYNMATEVLNVGLKTTWSLGLNTACLSPCQYSIETMSASGTISETRPKSCRLQDMDSHLGMHLQETARDIKRRR